MYTIKYNHRERRKLRTWSYGRTEQGSTGSLTIVLLMRQILMLGWSVRNRRKTTESERGIVHSVKFYNIISE